MTARLALQNAVNLSRKSSSSELYQKRLPDLQSLLEESGLLETWKEPPSFTNCDFQPKEQETLTALAVQVSLVKTAISKFMKLLLTDLPESPKVVHYRDVILGSGLLAG